MTCNLLRIALAQINPTVGWLEGNLEQISALHARAAALGVDLVIFPELAVTGDPSEDLIARRSFHTNAMKALQDLSKGLSSAPALLIGTPWSQDGCLYNAAALIEPGCEPGGGQIATVRYKHELPNYGVFDEKRWFTAGALPVPLDFRGVRLGVLICEDMWIPQVAQALHERKAELLIVLNSSPFELDKYATRTDLARKRVQETGLPLLYVNQVGGQDELVFDGRSFVLDADGMLRASAGAFREELLVTQWKRNPQGWVCQQSSCAEELTPLSTIYHALVTGVRDYVAKNRFPGVLIGLSGGIDSALSAAVAVDALGADRVATVMMPSVYTSSESLEDAQSLASNLKCRFYQLPIAPAMAAFEHILAPMWPRDGLGGIVAENLQSRIRGTMLMALSNQSGLMVLATGNKSELAVGYATLYGDMCGGYSVLKDVYKTTVYELARWRNQFSPAGAITDGAKLFGALPDLPLEGLPLGAPPSRADPPSEDTGSGCVIPLRILTKAPSAELKPEQTDQDTLPAYDKLDAILEALIEREIGLHEIIAMGYDEDMVRRVWRMLDRAEHKRRQSPPGVKITKRGFGRDRRYPITNHASYGEKLWNIAISDELICK